MLEDFEIHLLTGGKSSRMGEDKSLFLLNGKKMLAHVIDAVLPLNKHIKLISNNPEHAIFGFELIPDNYLNCGPIGGLEAGLNASKKEDVLFLTCDIPFIKTRDLQTLIHAHKSNHITIAEDHSGIHPLVGCYSKIALPLIQKEIAACNYKITNTLDKFAVQKVFIDSVEALKNINAPSDL